MDSPIIKEDADRLLKKNPFWAITIWTVLFVALIIFINTHFEETKKILLIIKGADLRWFGLAVLMELTTYVFAGAVWYIVAKSADYYLSFKSLAALAIKQMSINQLLPTGGVAGNVIIVRAMKRLGLPSALSVEVLFIDMLAYYISFSVVTFFSLIMLFLVHDITPIIITLVGVFFIIEVLITTMIWAVVNHKKLNLPLWIKNKKIISRILSEVEHISSARVFGVKLLAQTSLLRLGIFLLDSGILFMSMKAIGVDISLTTAFMALVMASVAGALTLLPGGIGGFEAGSITTLVLLGTPLESAIVGTLLLRGLTLWIPLIPGLILAKEDLGFSKAKSKL